MRGFLKANVNEQNTLLEEFRLSKDIKPHPDLLNQVTAVLLATPDPQRNLPNEFADFLNFKNFLQVHHQKNPSLPNQPRQTTNGKLLSSIWSYLFQEFILAS